MGGSFQYDVADYVVGARNLIEAAGVAAGDTVLLLADRHSDARTLEALVATLKLHGAMPLTMVGEPLSRYGGVPDPVLRAMAASDVVVWVWPVFLTFAEGYRRGFRFEREDLLPAGTVRRKPYFVYFEGTPGLLATDYARFPNRLLWQIAAKVRSVVAAGSVVRLEGGHGTHLTAEYDGRHLYGMQFGPGDPPGRCHFPWGRCGVYNGERTAEGVVYLDAVQGIAGRLQTPLRWTVRGGRVVEVDGGGEVGEHCRTLLRRFPDAAGFVEIMFGYHPKANLRRGLADFMHWELISKMPWVGLGTPRDAPAFRHLDGAVLHTRLFIDDRLIVDEDGHLTLLDDADVREAAAAYGDPDDVLAPVSHAGPDASAGWE